MNILNDIFRIGGGKNDSLIAAPSTGEVSFKTAYQARHFGHFRFFLLKRAGTAGMAFLCLILYVFIL